MRVGFMVLALFVLATVTTGNAQPFPDRLDLGTLVAGEVVALNGIDFGDDAGDRVAGIGDLNDDGFDDVAVSAAGADPFGFSAGEVYVVFGATTAQLTEIELDELDGANGFRIDGLSPGDGLGTGLAGAGDVNGDGVDDLLIGAPFGDANGPDAGEVYVVFGRTSFPPVLDLATLDGTDGARIDGIDALDGAGISVAGAGDFDGDGIDDFLIGADEADPHGSREGEVYLGFGRTTWPATLELSSLNGETGFLMTGIDSSDNAGWAVARAGDVNGDGLSDVVIGAPFADPNNVNSGEAYLVFGRTDQPAVVALEDLNGTNGVTLNGVDGSNLAGYSVGGAGDLDLDGLDDLVIGAYGNAPDVNRTVAGASYVVYGRETWSATIELQALGPADGVTFNGIDSNDRSGWSVSAAGDFNGDGADDLILGAPLADPNGTDSGEAYGVFGTDALPSLFELDTLDGMNGTILEGASGADESGSSVAVAGDFNGDGVGDVIVGGPEGHGGNGIAHVVFGRFETGVTLGATGGSCPGPISIRSGGLAPEGTLAIFRGSGRGASIVPAGPCAGFDLDLDDAQLLRIAEANDRGQWLLTVEIGNPNICGTHLQVLDVTTCLVSNVTTVPLD